VYLVFAEKGVIKVQPDIVKIELEHFEIYNLFCFILNKFKLAYQNELLLLKKLFKFKIFNGINIKF